MLGMTVVGPVVFSGVVASASAVSFLMGVSLVPVAKKIIPIARKSFNGTKRVFCSVNSWLKNRSFVIRCRSLTCSKCADVHRRHLVASRYSFKANQKTISKAA